MNARAADKERCRSAYEEAQELRKRSSLVQASAELKTCVATCPSALKSDCETWLGEIGKLMPRVTLRFVDDAGSPISGVSLQIDGEPFRENEVPALDPGRHTFRAEATNHVAAEAREVLAAGETRTLVLTLKRIQVPIAPTTTVPASKPSAQEATPHSTPIAAYVLGGVGIAALATSGALAIKGQIDKSDLSSSCAPFCDESRVDSIRTTWWVAAGVGAGGAVLTGIATYLFLSARHAEPAITVGVLPSQDGATASASARF